MSSQVSSQVVTHSVSPRDLHWSSVLCPLTTFLSLHAFAIHTGTGTYQYAIHDTRYTNISRRVTLTMPNWTREFVALMDKEFTSDEEMMRVAIDLSKYNVVENTGGPFGCAIFETDTQTGKSKIFSVGVNRVTALNNSTCKYSYGIFFALRWGGFFVFLPQFKLTLLFSIR